MKTKKRQRIGGGPHTRNDVKAWIYKAKRKNNLSLGQVLDRLVDHARKTGIEL